MQLSERNGALIGAVQVADSDELMLISDQGTLVRTRVVEVSLSSRNTQGVTLIKLGKDEHLVRLVRLDELADDDADALEASGDETPALDNPVQDDPSV